MDWLALIRYELGPIPMFMWQYAAVLGLLALTLVIMRPLRATHRQSGLLYAVVLAVCGYGISALLHIYLPPPSSAPIRYDLLFLAGMFGGWRGGLLGYALIYGARLQWAGTVQATYTGIDMAIVALGGVLAHRWYADLDPADLTPRQVLLMWALRSLTLIVSGLVLLGLHMLPKDMVFFELLPHKNSLGSLVRKTLMAGPALLFFASVFALFRLDAQDRRRQRREWRNSREDSLTGLPNRRALGEHLGQLLQVQPRPQLTLISIGASNHAQLLLHHGLGWGDGFLRALAAGVHEPQTSAVLREHAPRVFQFTDLSLVLVLQQIDAAELERRGLADHLHQALSMHVRENHGSGALPLLTLTVSACDPTQHPDAASALRDLGLHLSTQAHEVRNVHFLRTSFAQAARREEWLLERLGAWIDTGSPPLAYMPKCDLHSRRVVGAEALLRFRDEQGALVSPGLIVALATRHRMLAAFEWSTLEQASRDARQWADGGQAEVLSVNISSASLVTPGFATRLLELLDHTRLPPRALMLELTEHDAVPDIDTVRDNVRLLTAQGVRLSLDDFGSGHSGLAVLARIQFSELKVDHTMVAMIGNPRMRSAIQLAVESARRYDATLVAEGVETENQLSMLLELGVRHGQGYLFARAIPLQQLMALSLGLATASQSEALT